MAPVMVACLKHIHLASRLAVHLCEFVYIDKLFAAYGADHGFALEWDSRPTHPRARIQP